jgi:hypothetical protein
MKVEIQLLWGTNEPKSPDAKHTPVEADIKKRLKDIPLRWTNYFLVRKMVVEVPSNGKPARQPVSEKCAVEIKDVGKSKIEVTYFGKDKNVETRKLSLPKNEILFYAGNAPGTNAWLLALKRLQ